LTLEIKYRIEMRTYAIESPPGMEKQWGIK